MRTTLTIDDDLAAQLHEVARERSTSFRDVVNSALRAGLGSAAGPKSFRTRIAKIGFHPEIDLRQANRLAADIEDEDLLRATRSRTLGRTRLARRRIEWSGHRRLRSARAHRLRPD